MPSVFRHPLCDWKASGAKALSLFSQICCSLLPHSPALLFFHRPPYTLCVCATRNCCCVALLFPEGWAKTEFILLLLFSLVKMKLFFCSRDTTFFVRLVSVWRTYRTVIVGIRFSPPFLFLIHAAPEIAYPIKYIVRNHIVPRIVEKRQLHLPDPPKVCFRLSPLAHISS